MEFSDQFRILLSGFDQIERGEISIRFNLHDKLLAAYKRNSGRGWLETYDMEPKHMLVEIWKDLMYLLGVSQEQRIQGIPIHEQPLFQELIRIATKVTDPDTTLEILSDRILPLVLKVRCLITAMIAQFQYKTPMLEIVDSARAGNRPAILQLIKLDPTYLQSDFVGDCIKESTLSKNDDFFEQLARHIAPDDKFWSLKGQRRYFALFILQNTEDYAYRTDREWADFLSKEEYEFPDYADAENVRRARGRYGLPRLKKQP